MSFSSTQFNPFGRYESQLSSLKSEIEHITEHLREEGKIREILPKIEKLTEIVKSISESAVSSLLSEIAGPLAKFIRDFSKNSDKIKDAMAYIRVITKFGQNVADRIVEPFNSEFLEQWAPFFEVAFESRNHALKEMAANLWKKTFGKVKSPVRYPGELRQILEKLPKKYMITLPPAAKSAPPIFADDEEIQENSQIFKAPKGSEPQSQNSFQLSQQEEADNLADKLLKEHKISDEKSKKSVESPRRRAPRLPSLLDEDSRDFVAITPPSSKKSKLTDRQKEKLAEATAPRTCINYMDEESQSSFSKREQLKKALTAMNFDVGEESVSVLPTETIQKSEKSPEKEEKEEKMEETEPIFTRRLSKRSRKLFSDSPAKSNGEISEKLEKIPKMSEKVESPPTKRTKIDGENPEKSEKLEDSAEKKTRGRPKKGTPKQRIPSEKPPLRSSSRTRKSEPTEDQKEQKEPEKIEKPIEKVENPAPEPEKPVEIAPKSPEYEFVEDPVGSPPKTPRTPSILRVGRRIGGGEANSPMTERKRNRVHFNEDSLPPECSSSSPATPRRKKSTFLESSSSASSPASSNNLLPQSPTISTSPFYPSLVNCQDPIDHRILQKMYGHFNLKAISGIKKSLQEMDVLTIGHFSALSTSQIEKFTWIRGRSTAEKLKGAKAAMAEFERNRGAEEKNGGPEAEKLENSAEIASEAQKSVLDAQKSENFEEKAPETEKSAQIAEDEAQDAPKPEISQEIASGAVKSVPEASEAQVSENLAQNAPKPETPGKMAPGAEKSASEAPEAQISENLALEVQKPASDAQKLENLEDIAPGAGKSVPEAPEAQNSEEIAPETPMEVDEALESTESAPNALIEPEDSFDAHCSTLVAPELEKSESCAPGAHKSNFDAPDAPKSSGNELEASSSSENAPRAPVPLKSEIDALNDPSSAENAPESSGHQKSSSDAPNAPKSSENAPRPSGPLKSEIEASKAQNSTSYASNAPKPSENAPRPLKSEIDAPGPEKSTSDAQNALKSTEIAPEASKSSEIAPRPSASLKSEIDAPNSLQVLQNTPEASQSPTSPIPLAPISSNVKKFEKSTMIPGNSRKNLAPIFFDKSRVKTEVQSPRKALVKPANNNAFLEDARLLSRLCSNLSHAHQSQWPNEKGILKNLSKASLIFRDIVQKRGGAYSEDDDDVEEDDVENEECHVADDVRALCGVYKRMLGRHSSSDSDEFPWSQVMGKINEAACLLRIIVAERSGNC